jgi:hypothetical protein
MAMPVQAGEDGLFVSGVATAGSRRSVGAKPANLAACAIAASRMVCMVKDWN